MSFVWNKTPTATTQTSVFGTAANPTASGGGGSFFGGFGTGTQQPKTTVPAIGTGGGLFGGLGTAAQPNTTATSGFGSGTGGGLFGFGTLGTAAQPNATTTTTAFGTAAAGNTGSAFASPFNSTFGSGAPSFFGAATSTPFARPQQQPTVANGSAFGTSFGSFNQSQAGTSNVTPIVQQSSSWMNPNPSFQQQQPTNIGSAFGPAAFGCAGIGTTTGNQSQPFNVNSQTMVTGIPNSTAQLPLPISVSTSLNQQVAIHNSVFTCNVFGDERDASLSNLNYLQACTGVGKNYYNSNLPPASITAENNSMYRFLGITYSHLIKETNHDGQVSLYIKKPLSQLRKEEAQLLSLIHSLIGTPEIFFTASGYIELGDNMAAITIHADDKVTLRRFSAIELTSTLLQPHIKPLLEKLDIVNVQPRVRPSQQEINEYLDVPPPGITLPVWRKALEQNPDPENMIPTVIIGPAALKSRLIAQRDHSTKQSEVLKLIEADISNVHKVHSTYGATIDGVRRRHSLLAHRIVLAMLKRSMLQFRGLPLVPAEIQLIKPLQELNRELSLKNNITDRLNKLTEQTFKLREESKMEGPRALRNRSSLEPEVLERIKQSLHLQQTAIAKLFDTVKEEELKAQLLIQSVDEIRRGNS